MPTTLSSPPVASPAPYQLVAVPDYEQMNDRLEAAATIVWGLSLTSQDTLHWQIP